MNSLGSLLVHVDASPRAECRLALAQLAALTCDTGRQDTSNIEAVYCTTPSFADLPLAFSESSAGAMLLLRESFDDRHRQARQLFDRVNASSAQPMRWQAVSVGPVTRAVVGRALYADLLFLGQHEPDALHSRGTPTDFVETVLIDSGKPAIVVPYAGTYGATSKLGNVVLIAWKPTREAARAVSAALPLLQRAYRIHFVIDADSKASGEDLEAYLRSHGVQAKIERQAALSAASAGEALLSVAADVSADLLVMGCYGHRRTHELLLGGVTRTVLQAMTLPVLMAH